MTRARAFVVAARAPGPQPSGSSRFAKILRRGIAARAPGPHPSGYSRFAKILRRGAATVCLVALALPATPARAESIDLASIVAAASAGEAAGGPQAKRFAALSKVVTKADRPGLADDFAKMQRAAKDLRGPLAGDAALAAAVASCVTVGLDTALDGDDRDACEVAARVESRTARLRCDSKVRAGRVAWDLARRRRDDGRDDLACVAGVKAANAFASARATAGAQVRKQDARPPKWHVVFERRIGALWSVTSTGAADPTVYVVGSPNGLGPQFLVGSPEGWAEVPLGGEGSLFWVTVAGDEIWACGEHGRVIRYDPVTRTAADVDAGATTRLWGIWGSAPDDVWIVGEGSSGGHVLRHFDGATWTPVAAPPEAVPHALYKVWGRAADDVWACGARGTLIHWDGVAWSSVPTGTSADLLTVSGDATRVMAVGSVFGATILEGGAGTFTSAPLPADVSSVAGVAVPPTGDAWAVGYRWTVLRRTGGRWRTPDGVPETADTQVLSLHGVHVDATGAVWIAGGNLGTYFDGVLLHLGPRTPSSEVVTRTGDFASRVQPVFSATCSEAACHAGLFASERLDLSATDVSLAGLSRRAAQAPLRLVVPGRPSASYLWRKLEGTHLAVRGSGTTMPQARDPLPKAELDAIRAWILR